MTEYILHINNLIKLGLSIEAYFVLYCIYKEEEILLSNYIKNCKAINSNTFEELQNQGYIRIKINDLNNDDILFDLLNITEKGKKLISEQINEPQKQVNDSNFEEFREYYPSIVKRGVETRRLHTNLKKCKIYYERLLSEVSHDILCKCAKLYHIEKIRSGSEMYMKNLDTWLNQGEYKQYLNDITNFSTDNREGEITNIDGI